MKLDIAYNTEKEDIRYPEYGRGIQEMLHYAATIPERGRRQKTVEAIVGMMQIVGPVTLRNADDYRDRLWNHAFAIADYKLEVNPPAGVVIRREDERSGPEPLGYPASATRFRHYGSSIQSLIAKAIEMPDGPKKEGFVEVIASYMKLAYKTWNKEHYVSDIIVKDDLEILSDGRLELHEGHSSLDVLAAGVSRLENRNRINHKNNKNRSGGGKNRNGGGGGNKKQSQGYKRRRK